MKKFIFTIILCLIAVPMLAYADYDNSNGNILESTVSADKDLTPDKEHIAAGCMESIRFFFEKDDVDDSVIDYSRASKGYYGMPLYDTEELSAKQVEDFVENATAVYDIPVKYDDYEEFCSIKLTKGTAVTDEIRNNPEYDEEDIRRFENDEGRWSMSTVGSGECEMDYIGAAYDLLDEYDIHNSFVYFIGGIGNSGEAALVIFRENSDIAEFIVIDDRCVNFDKTMGFVPNTKFGKKTYTYSELKQLDAENFAAFDPNAEVLLGGNDAVLNVNKANNCKYAMIAGGAVLAVSATALIINFALKKKNRGIE